MEPCLLDCKICYSGTATGISDRCLCEAMVIIPSDVHEAAVRMLGESGIRFNPINSDQLLSIFDAPKKLTEEFLNIDKYIAAKRLYYDNDVYIQTIRHKNSLRG